jgi:hypothetical protein
MRPTDYLPPDTPPLNVAIVERAHDDIGEGEDLDETGRGTNRSTYVDRLNTRFGSPLGSYWCANAVGTWWKDAGAEVPPKDVGAAESWRTWAVRTGRFSATPVPGAAVLYGESTHAHHIGVIAKIVRDPTAPKGQRVITIEGNTSIGKYNRDGWIVAEKVVDLDHVIGYVTPIVPADVRKH